LDGTDLRARWLYGAEAHGLVAFALACFAAIMVVTLALTSDSSRVRWWLVAVPPFATLVALAVPRPAMRLAALVVLVVWCLLVSVGFFFAPAALALLLAVGVDRPRRRTVR